MQCFAFTTVAQVRFPVREPSEASGGLSEPVHSQCHPKPRKWFASGRASSVKLVPKTNMRTGDPLATLANPKGAAERGGKILDTV